MTGPTSAPAASGIAPGDLLFTTGGGFAGAAITHGTGSSWAHAGVFHTHLLTYIKDGHLVEVWRTVEAFPKAKASEDGVRWRTREVPVFADPHEALSMMVLRVARDEGDQAVLLWRSTRWAEKGIRYAWAEILRCILRVLGIKVGRWTDSEKSAICSHHAADCTITARPDLAPRFPLPTYETWPGLLAQVLLGSPQVQIVQRRVWPHHEPTRIARPDDLGEAA